ncbi:MAG: 50S ribosomal protein L24e [Candidatus Woesearchaeota archaeon]
MAKCSFCRSVIEPGTGTMYVRKDGTVLNFCAMKCEKNMLNLGRTPRFTKWTKAFEKGEVKK